MRVSLLLTVAALGGPACGDDGGSLRHDAGDSADHDAAVDIDAPVDAKPPNLTHRGLVQLARVGSTNGSISIGFYETPQDAPGCTWTYAGACSLQACEPTSGLVADSAGDVTVTVDGMATTVSPNAATYQTAGQPAPLTTGSSVTMTAAGDTVPAFSSPTLIVPAALEVLTPISGTGFDRTQTLTASWTPVAGRAYINVSQTGNSGPYPASYLRTIRCDVDAQLGTVDITPSLLGAFTADVNAYVTVAANVTETQDVGVYEVQSRVLSLDMVRMLGVQ